MKYRRLLPLLTPVIIWILSQVFLAVPRFLFSSLALGVLVIVISVKLIVKNSSYKNWPLWIITPSLFFLGATAYTAMIVSHFWIQSIFLLVFWFLFVYLRKLYYYPSGSDQAGEFKLDNLLAIGNCLGVAAISGVMFGLPAFFSWPTLFVLAAFAIVSALSFFQFYPFSGNLPNQRVLIFISVVILTELAGVFFALPLSSNVLALFLAIVYYLLLYIMRLDRRGALNRRSLLIPLILGALMIAIALLTARWL